MNELKTFHFEGIGTHWWIQIPKDATDTLAANIKAKLLEILNDFDWKYSRFKEPTLISKLNKDKKLQDFPEELYNMLILSEKVRELTHGSFDVCAGTHLENLGYDSNYSFVSSGKVDSGELGIKTLTKNLIEITPKTRIDLGGIGKGWLINKFKVELEKFNLETFIINGGGDIYAYNSENNIKDKGLGYEFVLENPFDNSEMIGKISISNEAIASSSPSRRAWKDKKSGKVNHHLIDFKKGGSTSNVKAVFTQGKSIINADLASTAIFISDLNLTEKIAAELEVEYLVVFPNGEYIKSKNYSGVLN